MSDLAALKAENAQLRKKLRAVTLCRQHEKRQLKALKDRLASIEEKQPKLLTIDDMKKLIK